jgi:UDP-glucose 4-epimerase
VIHEEDVADSLVHAVLHDAAGAYNVAAEGVLPLSQLMAVAGKLPVPLLHLAAYWGRDLLKGPDVARFLPIEPDYLRYHCVADLGKMHDELGWAPRYTAMETLREFAGQQRLRRFLPERAALAYDEERLRDTLERRRRARSSEASLEGPSNGAEPEVITEDFGEEVA